MVGILFSEQNTSSSQAQDLGNITELVRGNEQILLDCLMPLVHSQSISLDLQSVTRIDAAGLAALITLYCEACKAGHNLTVTNPSHHVREIFELVGLDRILVSQPEAEHTLDNMRLQESAA